LLEDQSAWLTWLATDPQSSAVDACSAQAEHYRQMLQHTWRITRAYRQYDWIEFAAAWDALLQEAALFPKEGACLPLRHLYQVSCISTTYQFDVPLTEIHATLYAMLLSSRPFYRACDRKHCKYCVLVTCSYHLIH
jgi:hypothetical protein